jgi:hypothetical protein
LNVTEEVPAPTNSNAATELVTARKPSAAARQPRHRVRLLEGINPFAPDAPVLPHEILFGAFLVVTWIRLTVRLGFLHPFALIFLFCLAGAVSVIAWCRRHPSGIRWRLRLLFYPAVMGVTFYTLRDAVPALGEPLVDSQLLQLDRALLGETPSVPYQHWGPAWLNDFLMLGYLFFFVHLLLVPGAYCGKDLPRFRQCIVGLFVLYGVGFLSYTLLPAGGPHRWMHFPVPLEGVIVLPWTLAIVNDGSNGVDVFPSLHFAISLYLLVFDWWHNRRRFWWCLVPCLVMWFATVLLRFHYVVDLIGGLGVALLALAVAWKYGHASDEPRPGSWSDLASALNSGQRSSRD